MSLTRETALNSYITDMLALEDHIEKALKAQVAEFRNDHPAVGIQLTEMDIVIQRHITALAALADNKPASGVSEVVKRAVSIAAGLGAAAIDLVRHEKLPKDLRDDYTAFSLAAVGYLMLHTTAVALNSPETARLALRHLEDYTEMTMTLGHLIPGTVIGLLEEEGLTAKSGAVDEVHRNVGGAWRAQATTA